MPGRIKTDGNARCDPMGVTHERRNPWPWEFKRSHGRGYQTPHGRGTPGSPRDTMVVLGFS